MTYDLTILVPVYNEEASLPELLGKLSKVRFEKPAQLIIVNDGSSDNSQAIIDKWAQKKRPAFSVECIEHAHNKGKGAGIQTGLRKAKGRYFVIQDADLEYNPAEIPALLSLAIQKDAAVVYGSRFLGNIQNMPQANYYANRLYNFMLRVFYGVKITDMHTCYKMIRTDLFKELGVFSQGFGYATEVISKLLRNHVQIIEAPISYNGRSVKEGKKINALDGLECLYQLIKYRFEPREDLFAKKT